MRVLLQTFSADGPDLVEQRMRQMYGVAFMDTDLSMRDELTIGDRYMLGMHDFTGSAAVETAPATSLIIATATGGRWDWEIGDARGSGLAAPFLIRPDSPSNILLADTHVDSVVLEVDALTQTARAIYADDSLTVRVDDGNPVSPHAADAIRRAMASAAELRPFILESELVAASIYRFLAVTALESFPLHGDPIARRSRAGALHSAYRHACTFIDEFASLPITREDVASAVGQPEAALDAAFRFWSNNGGGIAARVRMTRLEAARQELIAADPTRGDTVRQIALRWGFHPSRFAAQFRAAYGVNPKWVLDR